MRPLTPLLTAAALLLSATAAGAGASSTPFNYQPDPGLRTAGRGELEARIRRACGVTQARRTGQPESSFARGCGCYASRTLKALDRAELDAYRSTGYFNDTARAKAVAAIDACNLQRPI